MATHVTRKHFETYGQARHYEVKDYISEAVESLIAHLYNPNAEVGWRVDNRKLKRCGMDSEAVNWGDLHCVDVEEYSDGSIEVFIEEASPHADTLCNWIEGWLRNWGWDTTVRSEW